MVDEITHSFPVVDVVCAPYDARVATAAWNGTVTGKGDFARAIESVAAIVGGLPRHAYEAPVYEVAS